MSSRIEERVQELKSGSLSLGTPGLSQQVMLEVQPDNRTVRILGLDVSLVITGDAYEQFMANLIALRLPPEKAFQLEAAIYIPRLLRVPNAQSSLSMRGLGELSITMSIEIPLDSISLPPQR